MKDTILNFLSKLGYGLFELSLICLAYTVVDFFSYLDNHYLMRITVGLGCILVVCNNKAFYRTNYLLKDLQDILNNFYLHTDKKYVITYSNIITKVFNLCRISIILLKLVGFCLILIPSSSFISLNIIFSILFIIYTLGTVISLITVVRFS